MSSVAECELLLPHSERRPPLLPNGSAAGLVSWAGRTGGRCRRDMRPSGRAGGLRAARRAAHTERAASCSARCAIVRPAVLGGEEHLRRRRRQVGRVRPSLPSNVLRKAQRVTPRSPPEFLEAKGVELASGVGRCFHARGMAYSPLVTLVLVEPRARTSVASVTRRMQLTHARSRRPLWVLYITR
jgi:hypothetical protein